MSPASHDGRGIPGVSAAAFSASGWILVASLLATSGFSQEHNVSVTVRMIRLSSPTQFKERCGAANARVYACTQFVGEKVSAQCVALNDRWGLRLAASYIALTYVFRRDFIFHEQLHIRDMELSVANFLRELQAARFQTDHDCQIAARSTCDRFATQMQAFARESNKQRGCLIRRRAASSERDIEK